MLIHENIEVDWKPGEEIAIVGPNPNSCVVMFVNTGDPAVMEGVDTPADRLIRFPGATLKFPTDIWTTIDFSQFLLPLLPYKPVAAHLNGKLLISDPTVDIEDLKLWVRQFGTTHPAGWASYSFQAINVHAGGGERSNFAAWCPLENCRLEVKWTATKTGDYPSEASFGINMRVDAFKMRESQASPPPPLTRYSLSPATLVEDAEGDYVLFEDTQ